MTRKNHRFERNNSGVSINIVVILMLLVLACWSGAKLLKQSQSKSWPTVAATTTFVSIPNVTKKTSATTFDVQYTYCIGKIVYVGTTHYHDPELLNEFKKGAVINIHYDPTNPGDSADPRAWLPIELGSFIGAVLFILMLGVEAFKEASSA